VSFDIPAPADEPRTPPPRPEETTNTNTEPLHADCGNDIPQSYPPGSHAAEEEPEQIITLAHVKKKLWDEMIQCPDDASNRFLPRGQLSKLVTRKVVSEVIRCEFFNEPEAEAQACADFVWGEGGPTVENGEMPPSSPPGPFRPPLAEEMDADPDEKTSSRKIFTILMLISKVKLIRMFKEAGIRDRELPFIRCKDKDTLSTWQGRDLAFLTDKEALNEFYSKQRWIHIPFIKMFDQDPNTEKYRLLHNDTILPFTDWDPQEQQVDESAYAKVTRVAIHPDHHRFTHVR